jgi:hypothetical protein
MDPDQHSTSLEFFVETDTKYVRATRHLRFSKHGLDWLLTFMRPRNKLFNLSFAGLFIRPGAVFNASGVVTLVNLVDEAKSLISGEFISIIFLKTMIVCCCSLFIFYFIFQFFLIPLLRRATSAFCHPI